MSAQSAPPTLSRKRRVRRIIVIGLSILAVVVLVVTGVTAGSVLATFQAVEKIPNAFPAEADRPPVTRGAAASSMNFLLLGSDSRGEHKGSLAEINGQNSDTLVVMHVPADRDQITVMSIPRDTWLAIPGHGEAKVSAAMSWGGVPLAVQTVESLIDARIDHVAVVDFGGFQGLTDALGGVDIDNPIAFDSFYLTGHAYPRGPQHLTGTEALAFARERAAFPDGDVQRVHNQQLLIAAIFDGIMEQATLTDPGRVSAVIGAVTEHLAVDDTLASTDLVGLGVELREVRADDVAFFTIPTLGPGTSPDGQVMIALDRAALPAVQDGFRSDTLDDLAVGMESVS